MPWKIRLSLQNSLFVFWRIAVNTVRSLCCLLLTQTLTLHNANSASLNHKWCVWSCTIQSVFLLFWHLMVRALTWDVLRWNKCVPVSLALVILICADPCMEETWNGYVSCSFPDTSVAVVEPYVYRYYWILRASTKSFVGFKMFHIPHTSPNVELNVVHNWKVKLRKIKGF